MTITEYANTLSARIRESDDPQGPAIRLGLQFAVEIWLQANQRGASALQWGLFASAVQLVQAELYNDPYESTFEFDPTILEDGHATQLAVRTVISAAAELLAAHTDGPQRWHNATAATQLRMALQDLP